MKKEIIAREKYNTLGLIIKKVRGGFREIHSNSIDMDPDLVQLCPHDDWTS